MFRAGQTVRGARYHHQAYRVAARSAAIRAVCAARQGRHHRRRADWHYKSGRSAVAIWIEGIEVFEQAVLTGGLYQHH